MKTWIIPVTWVCTSNLEIEANTLEQAIDIAERSELPIKEHWEYVDSTYEVNHDEVEYFNTDQSSLW